MFFDVDAVAEIKLTPTQRKILANMARWNIGLDYVTDNTLAMEQIDKDGRGNKFTNIRYSTVSELWDVGILELAHDGIHYFKLSREGLKWVCEQLGITPAPHRSYWSRPGGEGARRA